MAKFSRPNIDSVSIEKFINKGGSSTADSVAKAPAADRKRGRPKGSIKEEPPVRVEMRIPPRILEKIDQYVEEHPILTSRHAWLLQAIYEKVAKDFGE